MQCLVRLSATPTVLSPEAMALSTARAIGVGVTIAGLVPVGVGLFRVTRRSRGIQLTWLWLAVMGFCGVWMLWRSLHDSRTTDLQHLSLPVILGTGMVALSANVSRSALRRYFYVAVMLFVGAWSVSRLARENSADFTVFIGPVYSVILSLGGAVVIGDRLRNIHDRPHRDPVILLGIGTLATFAPAAAIEPVSAQLFSVNPDLTVALWLGRMGFLLVGSVLFTMVMAWTTPPRSLSGSS